MTVLLNPKSSEKKVHFFLLRDSCRVPRPWEFSSATSVIFLQIIFFFLAEVS